MHEDAARSKVATIRMDGGGSVCILMADSYGPGKALRGKCAAAQKFHAEAQRATDSIEIVRMAKMRCRSMSHQSNHCGSAGRRKRSNRPWRCYYY